ncbi:hypothetical protein FPQ18DRAFT_345769 [Pyronema domesticum]|uniref:Uncharacterized protein n=1 Tax=Pyronema omphalodes (strain CBS 100304) TaxID=1076935 RepID=U4L4X9_PYROM|nr:hypothetical protein FPQ18DRAFT_345769 [Pyronema domesticum]CCX05100.1 Protein of unknown function [Pyronema omphalodes CBS 100304]
MHPPENVTSNGTTTTTTTTTTSSQSSTNSAPLQQAHLQQQYYIIPPPDAVARAAAHHTLDLLLYAIRERRLENQGILNAPSTPLNTFAGAPPTIPAGTQPGTPNNVDPQQQQLQLQQPITQPPQFSPINAPTPPSGYMIGIPHVNAGQMPPPITAGITGPLTFPANMTPTPSSVPSAYAYTPSRGNLRPLPYRNWPIVQCLEECHHEVEKVTYRKECSKCRHEMRTRQAEGIANNTESDARLYRATSSSYACKVCGLQLCKECSREYAARGKAKIPVFKSRGRGKR